MYTKEELKQFVFDTLGDFVNPNTDIEINRYGVMVLWTRGVSKEIFIEEWKKKTAGTPFENVSLFLPK